MNLLPPKKIKVIEQSVCLITSAEYNYWNTICSSRFRANIEFPALMERKLLQLTLQTSGGGTGGLRGASGPPKVKVECLAPKIFTGKI